MKIGISIPNNWGVAEAGDLIDIAVLAEELGFASVWTSEHLINTAYVRSRIGEGPYYHPLAVLSCIAGRTRRIALATSVMVLPFHNPFDLAKYAATLDQLSKGRLILGVGVGNMPEEFEALGIPWTKRGALTDESIDVMQALWSPGSTSHSGGAWTFADIHTSPKPYAGRRIPVWVGGMSEAALRRAARVGDGWQPTGISPAEFASQAAHLRTLATDYGRVPQSLDLCMRFNMALGDEVVTETELRSTIAGCDMAKALAVANDFAAAGATHFIFALNSSRRSALEDALRALARDVLPHFPGHTVMEIPHVG